LQAKTESESFGYRLRTVLLVVPMTPILGCVGFAIRTGLAGGDATAIESDLILGGLFSFIIAALIGSVYLFTDRRNQWHINWRIILFTIYLTAAITAFLYTVVDAELFRWLIPMAADVILMNTTRRAVLGVLDGCGYGLALGAFISLFDPRVARFTRSGIIRYSAVYSVFFTGNIIIMLLNFSTEFGDRFSGLLVILLIFAIRVGINWWDRRHSAEVEV
jgi:hypothetical protein